jgi:hypothetical protein
MATSISNGAQYVTPDSKIYCDNVKSKSAGLAQEIGFVAPNSCTLQWLLKCATQLCTFKKECNKLDLRLSISDWSIIMIGPGGLLLVVPMYMQFRGYSFIGGVPKKTC